MITESKDKQKTQEAENQAKMKERTMSQAANATDMPQTKKEENAKMKKDPREHRSSTTGVNVVS